MNAPITITASVAVWLHNTEYSGRPQDLMAALERGDTIAAVNMLSFYGPTSKESFSDCTRVGEADLTVRLLPRDQQTAMAVEQLNRKLEMLRTAYHQRQQEILSQIQNLQALTNEVPA